MKTKLLFLTLALLLSQNVLAADAEDRKLISVSGESKVYVEPDEVHVAMTVEIQGKSLTDAQKQNDDITAKVLKLLQTKLNIESRYVQTNSVNVEPVYTYNMCGNTNCPTPTFSHFVTRKGISITLKDVTQLQSLLEGAIEAGVTRIDSVEFASSRYDQLRDKAQVDATKDARKRADAIAAALGVTISGPYRIDVQQNSGMPYQPKAYAMVARSESADTIAVGQLLITANVTASFEIEK